MPASAARMSGRRRSRSDGTPTARRGGRARDGAGRGQLLLQRRRLQAEQHAQAVDGLLRGGLQQRDLGRRGGHLRLGVGHVQPAHEPGVEPLLRELGRVLLRLQVAAGDGSALLEGAQVDVVHGHLGGQRDQHVLARLDRRLHVRIGGLDAAAGAAEDVQLPRRVEAGLPHVADGPLDAARGAAVRAGRLAAPEGGRQAGRGAEGGRGDAPEARAWRTRDSASFRSRLESTARSISEVRVGSSKAVHQWASAASFVGAAPAGSGPAQAAGTSVCWGA